jgi:hypothetical protein
MENLQRLIDTIVEAIDYKKGKGMGLAKLLFSQPHP